MSIYRTQTNDPDDYKYHIKGYTWNILYFDKQGKPHKNFKVRTNWILSKHREIS